MKILNLLRKFYKALHRYRPTAEVMILQKNLLHNLREFQSCYPGLAFAPVLKSNAYGHGLVPVAQILDNENIAFFVLDSLHEAMILRRAGIRSKILIVGFTLVDNILSSGLPRVAYTITSIEQLRELAEKITKLTNIHLKIDTGMHRQGILPSQAGEAIEIISSNKKLFLDGLCSHFADADSGDDAFTKKQIEIWEKIVSDFKQKFSDINHLHISASAGTIFTGSITCNVGRIGLALYGIAPSAAMKFDLRPVMEVRSLISSIKDVPAGEGVGYNLTFVAPHPVRVATIPMGYFEGVDRRLSNTGLIKTGNQFCPIIGRVSMNITTIDVTDLADPKPLDPVIVISSNPDDPNSIQNIAKRIETIPYEIMVHIPQNLRRTVIK